jgi:hypothetical protein
VETDRRKPQLAEWKSRQQRNIDMEYRFAGSKRSIGELRSAPAACGQTRSDPPARSTTRTGGASARPNRSFVAIQYQSLEVIQVGEKGKSYSHCCVVPGELHRDWVSKHEMTVNLNREPQS